MNCSLLSHSVFSSHTILMQQYPSLLRPRSFLDRIYSISSNLKHLLYKSGYGSCLMERTIYLLHYPVNSGVETRTDVDEIEKRHAKVGNPLTNNLTHSLCIQAITRDGEKVWRQSAASTLNMQVPLHSKY